MNEMDVTPKKLCNRKVKICNSHLSNVYDSIDLFGKMAQKENVIEKLKEVGDSCIQVSHHFGFALSMHCAGGITRFWLCLRKVSQSPSRAVKKVKGLGSRMMIFMSFNSMRS